MFVPLVWGVDFSKRITVFLIDVTNILPLNLFGNQLCFSKFILLHAAERRAATTRVPVRKTTVFSSESQPQPNHNPPQSAVATSGTSRVSNWTEKRPQSEALRAPSCLAGCVYPHSHTHVALNQNRVHLHGLKEWQGSSSEDKQGPLSENWQSMWRLQGPSSEGGPGQTRWMDPIEAIRIRETISLIEYQPQENDFRTDVPMNSGSFREEFKLLKGLFWTWMWPGIRSWVAAVNRWMLWLSSELCSLKFSNYWLFLWSWISLTPSSWPLTFDLCCCRLLPQL